jgi:hypothetical protein
VRVCRKPEGVSRGLLGVIPNWVGVGRRRKIKRGLWTYSREQSIKSLVHGVPTVLQIFLEIAYGIDCEMWMLAEEKR